MTRRPALFLDRDGVVNVDRMKRELAARGTAIEDVFVRPDHPGHGIGAYRRHSPMRKPGPGMILGAARHDLDLGKSVLVGDQPTDVAAGAAAGVAHNVLVSAARPTGLPEGTLVMDGLFSVARGLGTLR